MALIKNLCKRLGRGLHMCRLFITILTLAIGLMYWFNGYLKTQNQNFDDLFKEFDLDINLTFLIENERYVVTPPNDYPFNFTVNDSQITMFD